MGSFSDGFALYAVTLGFIGKDVRTSSYFFREYSGSGVAGDLLILNPNQLGNIALEEGRVPLEDVSGRYIIRDRKYPYTKQLSSLDENNMLIVDILPRTLR